MRRVQLQLLALFPALEGTTEIVWMPGCRSARRRDAPPRQPTIEAVCRPCSKPRCVGKRGLEDGRRAVPEPVEPAQGPLARPPRSDQEHRLHDGRGCDDAEKGEAQRVHVQITGRRP